jgi:hypothetical protein
MTDERVMCMWETRNAYKILAGDLNGRDHLEKQDVVGRTISNSGYRIQVEFLV